MLNNLFICSIIFFVLFSRSHQHLGHSKGCPSDSFPFSSYSLLNTEVLPDVQDSTVLISPLVSLANLSWWASLETVIPKLLSADIPLSFWAFSLLELLLSSLTWT